jgi:CheY-like chemotaxis protein
MSMDRDVLLNTLPALRRYARALAGDQQRGDAWLRAWLEGRPDDLTAAGVDAKTALFRSFNRHLSAAPGLASLREDLAELPLLERQLLLLTAIERLSPTDAAIAVELPESEAQAALRRARAWLKQSASTDVLIIEDEPIIAMDIETIVRDLGHSVTGVAVTRDEAVQQALARRPSLVLADIQLADDSSGIDAVKDILHEFKVPVIFITAFPERLLTGERPEPTFLITKPFQRSTVKAQIAQALFFDTATIPA